MRKNKTFADLKNGEKLARQQVIIDAAERVFAVKPFNKVSIRDVAREAGISHAAIYRYFPDQRSLFMEAFLRGADEIILFLTDMVENTEKIDIGIIAETYLTYLIENDQFFRMMTHFMLDGSLTAEMIDKLNFAARRIFDQFDIMFRKMGVPEPVRPLSHAFFASLNGIMITFKNYPGRDQNAVREHIKVISTVITEKFMV
ncbi:MAG: hypothetical protein AVO39_03745 [delta proteobacterium MLS_D]|jgi:AcrR family transcriptional regulator|nr:MAG: hypothetical protein AVO39_03745 [delta proteobacterium MLS_D]